MSASRIREAAKALRDAAESVNAEIDSGHRYWVSDRNNYSTGVRGALGGASGELAALMTPPVVLAVADWLDRLIREVDEDSYHLDEAFNTLTLANTILGDRA